MQTIAKASVNTRHGVGRHAIAIALGALALLSSPSQAVTVTSTVSHSFIMAPGPWSVFIPGWYGAGSTRASNTFQTDVDNNAAFGFPSGGGSVNVFSSVAGASASAIAYANWSVSGPFLIGNAVAISSATANFAGTTASAQSAAVAFGFLGQIGRFGNIRWNQLVSIGSFSQSNAFIPPPRARDPIIFSFESGGQDFSGTLFDSDAQISNGTIDWDNGQVVIATVEDPLVGSKGFFKVDMDSPNVINGGSIDFAFDKGIVTQSDCTGIFCSIFPAVGQSAGGSYNLGLIDINYDLGVDGPLDVNWGFSNLSNAAVPEPGSWAMMIFGFGLVGVTLRRRSEPRITLQ